MPKKATQKAAGGSYINKITTWQPITPDTSHGLDKNGKAIAVLKLLIPLSQGGLR